VYVCALGMKDSDFFPSGPQLQLLFLLENEVSETSLVGPEEDTRVEDPAEGLAKEHSVASPAQGCAMLVNV
jgi:hypothetical protein